LDHPRPTTRTFVWLPAFLFALIFVGVAPPAGAQETTWSLGTDMPFSRGQVLAVYGDDGYIYLFGGSDAAAGVVDETWRYDIANETYDQLADMPTTRRAACGDLLPDGRIVVTGGYHNGQLSVTEIYDPTTDTWDTAASVSSGWECAAFTGDDGHLHLFGGEDSEGTYYSWDPSTDTWTAGPAMPNDRKCHGANLGDDGQFYVFGGSDSLTTMDVFDPVTQTWAGGAALPAGNQQFGWATNGDWVYVLGGSTNYGNNSSPYYDYVWLYDVDGGGWTEDTASLPEGMRETYAVEVDGGLFVFGGSNGSYQATVQVGCHEGDPDGDGHLSWACGGDDCDNDDPLVYPGADEICDGLDNDCDGDIDEGPAAADTWYEDFDGDGYGDPDVSQVACDQPSGYVDNADDCDDEDADQYPGADEYCNGEDDDCDGAVDEDDAVDADTWYLDADGDGYGDPASPDVACDAPADHVANDGDCDDTDANQYPGADEYCNGEDDDCDGTVDEDDALDASTWYLDADGDTYGNPGVTYDACDAPQGFVGNADDCDDTDPDQYPGANEYCNGEDDDCDGEVDEGDALDASTWYQDLDGDTYGNVAVSTQACDQPPGYVANVLDCDDADPAQYPGANEYCNGEDDDCDGTVDEDDAVDAQTYYEDADGDTYGNVAVSVQACTQPQGYVTNVTDCDDGDPNQYPGADELCNGEDDDCDGDVDEGTLDAETWYADGDGDGFGDAGATVEDCSPPQGYVDNGDDCDDGDPDQFPGADEYCNGEDDDCDGAVDEDDALDAQPWWADLDGDGFGDAGIEETACSAPPSFVGNPDDCDDADPAQYPGAMEFCNGEDDDCDGEVDEDEAFDAQTWYADQDGDGFGDPAMTEVACDPPQDFVANADDCDPADPAQYPGADEYCNGEDDDCDGDVDEDALDDQPWFIDNDGDGYGDSTVIEFACDQPPSFVDNDLDCDDSDPDVNPDAEEVCNGIDDDCDHATDELVDGDGDTYSICDGDCDDMDVDVNPDAEEVCDGIDNDCDPATDEEVDGDGDGVTICGGDCDDTDPALFPGNPEICDGVDNDCDGALPDDEIDDDGDGMTECEGDCDDDDALTYTGAPEQCDQLDNDCDGEVDEDVDEDLDFDGFNACQGDCDNNDPNVYPFALEICDGKDDDCDGDLPLDELDEDLDGAMVCEGDCDDGDAALNLDDLDADAWTTCDGDCDDDDPATYPTAAELCDGIDNDCDGSLADDEVDADGDGYMACDDCDDDDPDAYPGDLDGDGYDACDDDCDDSDPDVNPGADELCDGIDNDCDGAIDDVDADGDGHPHEDCGGDDCDDEDAAVNPDEPEICDDGIDNDCDGDFDGFDAECEDEGDDDDDDDTTGGGCDCENNQAPGATASPVAALTALAFLVWIRRRTR